MTQTVKAIVLSVQDRKDSDRLAWLLCDFGKIIRVYLRGAKSPKSKLCAASEPFVLGTYELYKSNSGFVVDDATITEQFFPLRGDLKSYSLAGYLCELTLKLFSEDGDVKLFTVLANCLHLLSEKQRDPALIKAIFEWKAAAFAGYAPIVNACQVCGSGEQVAFSVTEASGYCAACANEHHAITVGSACMKALQAVVGQDERKAFGFTLSGDSLDNFAAIAEAFLLYRYEQKIATLDYYKSLVDFEKKLDW